MILNRITCLVCCVFILAQGAIAQKDFYDSYTFTRADTLRGMLRPERTVYDVHFYHLDITVNPDKKSIGGYVEFQFEALRSFKTLQFDLFENMKINRVEHRGASMYFDRIHDAVFVDLLPGYNQGEHGSFRVYYEGTPVVAKNAPWDGGFVWKRDKNDKPWIGVACEGVGASLWWPCKDHLSDEPDSMLISIAAPSDLMVVSNGNLQYTTLPKQGYKKWHWFVSYPINNYNVTVNIADYVHFEDTYVAGDGDSLQMDFYVLPYNLEKAKKQFAQSHKMFACFERYFGKYPFWDDGYALVEAPYLGMEHQSAIAYGNQYMRGYMGGMIPRDMDWDYIIVHETGHEWFGNSISVADLAEMWIHESFTTYMEALYVECAYSYEDAQRYLAGQRFFILNKEPILGPSDVNWNDWKGSDHYFKGAWVLNTLRHAINDDELWFDILKSFYDKYAYSIVTTKDFVNHLNACTRRDWTAVMEQYLSYPGIPVLEYKFEENGDLYARWRADVAAFDMPVLVGVPGAYQRIFPSTEWQNMHIRPEASKPFAVATELFLIGVEAVGSQN